MLMMKKTEHPLNYVCESRLKGGEVCGARVGESCYTIHDGMRIKSEDSPYVIEWAKKYGEIDYYHVNRKRKAGYLQCLCGADRGEHCRFYKPNGDLVTYPNSASNYTHHYRFGNYEECEETEE